MDIYKINYNFKTESVINFIKNNPNADLEKIMILGINVYNSLEENMINNYSKDDLLDIVKKSNNFIAERILDQLGEKVRYDTKDICNSMIQSNNVLFERVNEKNERIFQPVIEHFSRIRENSSKKGQYSENNLELVLNQMFPSSEIINTSNIPQCCDIKLDRKEEKDIILFENKEYSKNIPKEEVEKFVRDIEINKHHGIFLSQKSGITSKRNLQCDIRNNKMLIYLHNVNYNPEIIQLAIDCIDTFSSFMNNNDINLRENVITNEDLKEINMELNNFLTLKQNMLDDLNSFQRKMQLDLSNLLLPSLRKLIDKRFGTKTNDNNELKCNICNKFTAKNASGLARHKKSCRIK